MMISDGTADWHIFALRLAQREGETRTAELLNTEQQRIMLAENMVRVYEELRTADRSPIAWTPSDPGRYNRTSTKHKYRDRFMMGEEHDAPHDPSYRIEG